jgi:hypothetical protein
MPLTGVWVNEHKSVMVTSEDSVDSLGGTFRSLVGRDTRKRPLVGPASSEEAGKQLLGFTVYFDMLNPGKELGTFALRVVRIGNGERDHYQLAIDQQHPRPERPMVEYAHRTRHICESL